MEREANILAGHHMRFRCRTARSWFSLHVVAVIALILAAASMTPGARSQQLANDTKQSTAPVPIERRDPALDAAAEEIGRALFLRCLCAENNLGFDSQGRLAPGARLKVVDWTLAGVNVQKVERKAPNIIELDGVRVVIRFAADRHEFERHPQKDESVQVMIADNGDPVVFERALRAVFAIGIDRPLQKSMPDYWQHYFEPGLAWPPNTADSLAGVTIYNPGTPAPVNAATSASTSLAGTVSAPVVTHRADANYTNYAAKDHIKGTIRVRMVVDAQGAPRRISVAVPLGYGLDEQAVKTVAKLRFTPAILNGQPVAANMVIDQEFVLAPVAHP